ncbi:MAG: hypothetical protein A6F71_10710 [Cycloclasticus sp. symbiont of Poecilosclerida sp. M]|nr:MAG: hypothetical protein A6F71_10710 [Cycloclasticus sp. symbiont of Poecilosclerida sp. M]
MKIIKNILLYSSFIISSTLLLTAQAATGYALQITSPQNDHVFAAGDGTVEVQLALQPSLRRGDQFILYMDDEKIAESKQSSFSVEFVGRGEHTIHVDIVNRSGSSIQQSDPVTFFVRRPIVRNN